MPRLRPTVVLSRAVRSFGLLAGSILALGAPATAPAQPAAMGPGAGWFDCNNDGHLDMCYLTPQGDIFLLVFDPGQQRFVDHSATAFPLAIQRAGEGTGVACGDVNNDGLSDLVLTFNGSNHLLLNNGDDTFNVVSRTAGIVPGVEGEVLSASAALLDYDRDGLLDIFVANYEGKANQLFHNGGVDEYGLPHFTDVAPTMGLDYAQNGQSDWTLGVAAADYDNDGDVDLYLANDYDGLNPDDGTLNPGENILYRNDNGVFVDVTYSSGANDDGWAMGVAFGDFNRDGWLDIFVTNFWMDALFQNNRNGTFTNVTKQVGIPTVMPSVPETEPCSVCNGWGTSFVDIDNDGDLDIHVANGYITNGEQQIFNEPNELWENVGPNGSGYVQFKEVGVAAGIADIGDGRGAAHGDFNRDGFVDMVVLNNNYIAGPGGPAVAPQKLLFVNQKNGTFRDMALAYGLRDQIPDSDAKPPRGNYAQNAWVEVQVRGTESNRSAYGARVTVVADGKTWIQDLGSGSYLSTNSPLLHFGLGSATNVDRVTVSFPTPGSQRTEVTKANVPVNSVITISEDDVTPVRLLGFDVAAVPEGARLRWRYADDGDLSAFAVRRVDADGAAALIAAYLQAEGGRGEYLDRDALAGVLVTYELHALFRDGGQELVGTVSFRYETVRAVTRQNYPNPFVSATTIPVAAAPGGRATVHVFDTSGRLIRTLRGSLPESGGLLHWDGLDEGGRAVPSGTYFYRVDGSRETLKMIRRR